jgi:hypothetical protein
MRRAPAAATSSMIRRLLNFLTALSLVLCVAGGPDAGTK